MSESSSWLYEDTVATARRLALTSPASFDELVSLASTEITNIRARVTPGRDSGLTHCLQPVFAFDLPTVGDRLFNGPAGYRAQYLRGPMDGLQANAKLITALTRRLLAAIDLEADPKLEQVNVCASLRAASAKFWIQEIPSLLLSPTVDLKVEPWRAEALRGVQLAQWGVSAPEVSKFEVKGALIDPHGNEVVPCRKITRHFDIHHYGFS